MRTLLSTALLFPALCSASAAQTAVTLVWDGDQGDALFGRALDFVDAAGRPLILIGAPEDIAVGDARVVVAHALTGETVRTLEGGPGQRFGLALSALGDTDGDGEPEVAVGAPGHPVGGPSPGRVHVFSLRDGRRLLTVAGSAPDEHLGSIVEALGDVNGDGAADFLAGSLGLGGVRCYDGASGAVLHETLSVPGFRGASLFGDLDGDGASDYAVAAQVDGPSVEVRSGVDGSLLARLGPAALQSSPDGFASDLTCTGATGVPDVDLDGTPDLVVGLPGDDGAGADVGRVSIYSGAGGAELQRVFGYVLDEGFGHLVAGAGDIDLDGSGDVLEKPLSLLSYVKGLSGRSGRALFSMFPGGGVALYPGYAAALAPARDVTGDGRPEFLYSDFSSTPGHTVRLYSPVDLPLDSDVELAFFDFPPMPMELDAGPDHAHELFAVLGSVSGTLPGIDLGGIHLPLNRDPYLHFMALRGDQETHTTSIGVLDASGKGVAQIGTVPELKGFIAHYAFVTLAPHGEVTFASNALPVVMDLLVAPGR